MSGAPPTTLNASRPILPDIFCTWSVLLARMRRRKSASGSSACVRQSMAFVACSGN
ncbi:Unknown protein sequence [Pseudomonas amygdali pv. lachrymans]|uniref:Uncharacterized protein n=1 Tax=Pseudomonas amygdali pv. lachrymans TaxID=53707 RepID=A0A0P9U9P6_PSEAV|nr:Unknown protein sequence [Pseudomonas amygdali pv. lachrymans]